LAATSYQPSTWASTKINMAKTAGILSENFDRQQFTEPITRRDFCELLINSYELFGYPLPSLSESHPFTDTQDKYAERAYALKFTSGTAEGIFSPDLPLTREMAVVMLGKLLQLLQAGAAPFDAQQAEQILQKYTTDSNRLSDWARSSMAAAYARGIIAGTAPGVLSPQDNVTREQAVILTLNTLSYADASRLNAAGIKECVLAAPSAIYISPTYQAGNVVLPWGEVPGAAAYEVRLSADGTLVYSGRTKVNMLDLRTSSRQVGESVADIFAQNNTRVQGVLQVIPVDEKGNLSAFSLRREFLVEPKDYQRSGTMPARSRFSSAAEAAAYMEDIECQVWQLENGIKKTATITLTVHKDVAEDVKKIFAEIYNGPEKFPIKSCYGFSYRGTSQHSSGLAIDINPDENYFIGRDGKIKAGKLWQPGVNPYSITPDGDVVRAFKKYGWHWSPEMGWSSGADYMHFSLSGT